MQNKDLIVSKDSELGQTEKVKMQIDVGNNDPIKLDHIEHLWKIEKWLTKKAIDEMLDANVIKRYRSQWSFPVDKNDGSKRLCVGGASFVDHFCYLCIVFVMLSYLFIAALWWPDQCHVLSHFKSTCCVQELMSVVV